MSRLAPAVCAAAMALVLVAPTSTAAYSVLTHQALIDGQWESHIQPLLQQRFRGLTADALAEARSFAYGGSVIQDLGYYPFGSKFFSNLQHYVRSGDFVETLIRGAATADEFAFALGALAHYTSDTTGHPGAVNPALPIMFPKLRKKFGAEVTYAEAPTQHVIAEFSFDVVQVAGGRYASDAYHRAIGFQVATALLERAFRETYGLEMKDILSDPDRVVGTYRYAVSQIVPALTEAAWRDKQDEIAKLLPGINREKFVYVYRRADYEREYGRDYQRPALFARFLAVIYRIVPKIGPLKPLSFKAPEPAVNRLFVDSFETANQRYRAALTSLAAGRLDLRNVDFDTAKPAAHGEYPLADDTYAELVHKLTEKDAAPCPAALKKDISAFYGPSPAPSSKTDRKRWARIREALAALLS
jgi:zinc dependent phospholipase C